MKRKIGLCTTLVLIVGILFSSVATAFTATSPQLAKAIAKYKNTVTMTIGRYDVLNNGLPKGDSIQKISI